MVVFSTIYAKKIKKGGGNFVLRSFLINFVDY